MSDLLEHHGTKLLQLKPASIVSAARADLARCQGKRDGNVFAGEWYSFHRDHVRRASCTLDLIERALKERRRGIESGKRITRTIYGDEALLRSAHAAARGVL